ncbi:MAG: DUF523 domain-containing protein [Proteobacteria bacterium]|nr:DUF523 domain-containing protein [Pseudomonadota bacterium]MBU1709596.1 DUF523 domain-containing protein [Pseudomonadota bacterium]
MAIVYPKTIYLVSACLVGLRTRHDGCANDNAACLAALSGSYWVPVCPEQLGGLSTPRVAADLAGGNGHDVLAGKARVVTRQGDDVTKAFVTGAQQVLKIAQMLAVSGVFFKARSPSCGVSTNIGVTAALLEKNGFSVREF